MLRRPESSRSATSLLLALLVHAAVGGVVFGLAMLVRAPEPPPGPTWVPPVVPPRAPPPPGGGGGGGRPQPPKAPSPPETIDQAPPPTIVEPALEDEPAEPQAAPEVGSGTSDDATGPGAAGPPGPGPGEGPPGEGPGGERGGGPTAAAAPERSEPMVLGSDMVPPRLLERVEPRYPPRAVKLGIRGTVVLRCVIDAEGRVHVREVLQPVSMLTESAVAAVETWRYEPAQWNGRPQAVFQTVRVTFAR